MRHALAGASAVFLAVLLLRYAGALEPLELALYDAGMRARPPSAVDPRFVIIDETEDDLVRFGHPLTDELLARAIEQALIHGARIVGVDKYRDIPVPPGSDKLESLLANQRNVYGVYQFGGSGVRRVPPPRALAGTGRAGFIDIVLDPDGTVRRGLLYLDDGGSPQPSFALLLALHYLSADGIAPRPNAAKPSVLDLGRATIPPLEPNDGGYAHADAAGYQLLLDFGGAPAPFARVTLGELLDARVDPARLRGRIAIIGSSAHSLRDFFQTPFTDQRTPHAIGAEMQAHHASQLLRLAHGESAPVRTGPLPLNLGLLALCCALGLVAWVAPRAVWLAVFIGVGAVALVAVWYASAAAGLWLALAAPALGFVLSVSICAGLRNFHERRERMALMALFSRYVAAPVARELWMRRKELGDGGALRPRRLEATVLFADLHGYSPVAERLSPEETARWLNEFMEPMAQAIMAHRGVVRQYAGDAVVAVFGAPIPSDTPDARAADARSAVACAKDMCAKFGRLNESWQHVGRPTAGLRIGIHSGPMVGCTIGSRERQEYAVVGDTVNVAARLQALALPEAGATDPCRILISAETLSLLDATHASSVVGSFVPKGRSEPVHVHRILA